MKLSNERVLVIDNILHRYGTATEPWFAYAVSKNRAILAPIVAAIQAAKRPSKEFIALEEARSKLLPVYARKNADGSPVFTQVSNPDGTTTMIYDIVDKVGLQAAVDSLRNEERFSGVVEAEEARIIKLGALLDAEVDVDPYAINMSDAPDGLITADDMSILLASGFLNWDLTREGAAKANA